MNAQPDDMKRSGALALLHAMCGDRVTIANVAPSVDRGRYAVKRTLGDHLAIEADIFTDGHEQLAACVAYRLAASRKWRRVSLVPVANDHWQSHPIPLKAVGEFVFCIEAWIDVFGGYVRDTKLKRDAGLQLDVEQAEGIALLKAAAEGAAGSAKKALTVVIQGFDRLKAKDRTALLLADETAAAMRSADARPFLSRSFVQPVTIERPAAGFAAWYELFPRSQASKPGVHGTFRDVIAQLPRISKMGFDVLYMPPIHPIGGTNRKGRNNALKAEKNDPGSTYAIGGREGGHDSLHPELGTLDDFRALVAACADQGIEIAMDFAVQMSPDHPWLSEHPDWFAKRPDGSIRFAENPPKKYEDIVNPDFYSGPALWNALRDVLLHWIAQGVRTFRVDNPHTKPTPFWEWLIADIRSAHPDVIFLAEAFTRPKRMYQLAKAGFSQSYSYFTWRNTKRELTEYFTELSTPPVSDFFRANLFVNTPDINPYFLQTGGRAAFLIRAALATTLSGLWGMYSGFELCEAEALPGREEYQNSEKYELKHRDFNAAGNIAAEISQLNGLRKKLPHLQSHLGVTFYNAFDENILYFAKTAPGRTDRVLVAVNLDPRNAHACSFELPLWEWGLPDQAELEVDDLLHDYRFIWHGKIQRMELTPAHPYAIWRVEPRTGG